MCHQHARTPRHATPRHAHLLNWTKAIGEEGMDAVKAHLVAGGGYIGTCGGAFLAIQHLKLYGEGPAGRSWLHKLGVPVSLFANLMVRWQRSHTYMLLSNMPRTSTVTCATTTTTTTFRPWTHDARTLGPWPRRSASRVYEGRRRGSRSASCTELFP